MDKPVINSDNTPVGVDAGRRQLFKKASYVAPSLVVLGFGFGSKNANAQIAPPPSDPNPPGPQSASPDPRYNKGNRG